MPMHMMYLMTIAAAVFVAWLATSAGPPPPAMDAGYYCIGQPDGVRVYAPGRVEDARAVIIWGETGRLHHIDVNELVECRREER